MPDDGALLEAWRAGDSAAGNELFDQHYRAIYRFFRSKVAGELDDLVQTTFTRCAASRERLEDGGSFGAYVHGVARNVLREHYRTHYGRDQKIDFGSASVADLGVSPTGVVAQQQEQRLLLEALRTIPLDHQIAIELAYWEGFKVKELAKVLDVPLGTAKTRLRTARKVLEARLAKLATSPAVLASTRDDLERWSNAVRDHLNDDPLAGR